MLHHNKLTLHMLYQLKVTQLKLPTLLLSDASGQGTWLLQHPNNRYIFLPPTDCL